MEDRTCSVDGCSEPFRAKGMCKRHYRHDLHMRTRERALAQMAKYRAEHPEQVAANKAKWSADPEYRAAMVANARAWDRAHPEEARERKAAHFQEHRGEYAERARRWMAEHPERTSIFKRENHGRYRVRRAGGDVDPTLDLQAVLERDGMVCHLCGDPIRSLNDLHFDHIVPVSKGGSHTPENIGPSHAACNLSKGARTS